jgi:hypothetical protein
MFRIFFSLSVLLLVFTACEKDDPVIPNEEEVITTLIYTLTPVSGGDPVVFSFQDLDGDGGNEPVISEGILKVNEFYNGQLELFSEVDGNMEDIGEEVSEEAEEHQFFFSTDVSGLSIAYKDLDADNNPIGLATELSTGGASSGTMTVILRHEPNKSGQGVAEGDITNAGGETDIEVTFNVNVE